MRYRICLIGNSHLASLKLGWDVIASRYPDLECTFFGAAGRSMRNMDIQGDSLVPATIDEEKVKQISGGMTSVRPNDYDAICLVGLLFGFHHWLKFLPPVHAHTMLPIHDPSHLVSISFLKQTARVKLENTIAVTLARMIKSVSDVPLLIVAAPLPSQDLLSRLPSKPIPEEQLRSSLAEYHEIFRTEAERCALGEGVRLVPQPPHTIAFSGFTRREFSHGSVRLASGREHETEDFIHMNQTYGAEVLAEISEVIRSDSIRPRSIAELTGA